MAGTFTVTAPTTADNIKHKVAASVFLSRATFGPSTTTINDLAARMDAIGVKPALAEWIDQQMALPVCTDVTRVPNIETEIVNLPVCSHRDLAEKMEAVDVAFYSETNDKHERYPNQAWWHIALTADDQLRQRMAWALSQIFVATNTSVTNGLDQTGRGRWLGIAGYYDHMVNNAYGNYRDLLGEVTFSPIMGSYLSHARNAKGTEKGNGVTTYPDENYAREVMQLFSIGLIELENDGSWKYEDSEPKETYNNERIKAFARLFTGLAYANEPFKGHNYGGGQHRNLNAPMVMFDGTQDLTTGLYGDVYDDGNSQTNDADAVNYHDFKDKTLLNGVTLSGYTDGAAEINAGLDNIFNHSNVGPFIARRLIQRFIMSNPSKSYIQRVALAFNDNGKGVRGDFKAVLKEVLLAPEAISTYTITQEDNTVSFRSKGTEYSRLSEPVLRITAMLRAFFYEGKTYPVEDRDTFTLPIEPYLSQNPLDETDPNYDPSYVGTEYPEHYYMLAGSLRLYQDSSGDLQDKYDQEVYSQHHVFNFYLPDHQPAGSIITNTPTANIPNGLLVAPEFEILNAVTANDTANLMRDAILSKTGLEKYGYFMGALQHAYVREEDNIDNVEINSINILDFNEANDIFNTTADPVDSKPEELLSYLDLLLCNGSLSDETKDAIKNAFTSESATPYLQVKIAIHGVLMSPSCVVQ